MFLNLLKINRQVYILFSARKSFHILIFLFLFTSFDVFSLHFSVSPVFKILDFCINILDYTNTLN